jgi:hypothetical protein
MKKPLNKSLCLALLPLLFTCNVSGQTEYLVKVDPANALVTNIDALPGVKWIATLPNTTTFDQNHHAYIFKGSPDTKSWFLYSVDATTGSIISSPPYPSFSKSTDNLIELEYDNSSNMLYGLHWNSSSEKEHFVSVDVQTGQMKVISVIPGVKWISLGQTAFDKNNHRYFFRGGDDNAPFRLYTIDANTGLVMSDPVFPVLPRPEDNISELHYDNSTNTLYGLCRDNANERMFLVTVDPATGNYTIITKIADVHSSVFCPHYSAFDEINQRYIFLGMTNTGVRLISIDVKTGTIISDPKFPVGSSNSDNVIELQVDNATGILYALHWESHTIPPPPDPSSPISPVSPNVPSTVASSDPGFSLYPNPFSTQSTVVLDKVYGEVTISITNCLGQTVSSEKHFNTSKVELNRNNMANGLYNVSIRSGNINLGSRKVVITE